MSSDFECLFRKDISVKSWGLKDIVKCVTVNRKRSDGRIFLQVRHFVQTTYTPTFVGVSLSSIQTRMLLELSDNLFKMEKPNTWDQYLTPEGLHNLTGSAWTGIAKGGKEVLLMRQNGDGLKGVAISVDEYIRLRECFGAIRHLMFPTPYHKDAEIVEAVAYELKRILNVLRYENCKGCELDLGNQEGHDCVMLDAETLALRHFPQAAKSVNIPRVMTHVAYLHDLLSCTNPIPTVEEVKNYLRDSAWYVNHIQKESTMEPLLTSFDELHP